MVDCSLLGNVQGYNWPSPHHDLCCLFLRDSHQAVPIHPQQLVSCLEASILPSSTSLNHSLDVNTKAFLSHSFGSHNTQTHTIGLAESDGLDFWLFGMEGSIAIDRTSHVLMRRTKRLMWGTSMMWGTTIHWSPISGPNISILIVVSALHLCSIHSHLAGLARGPWNRGEGGQGFHIDGPVSG